MRDRLICSIALMVGAISGAISVMAISIPRWDGVLRSEAVDAGVAHYVVNPETGAVKFEWIKPEGVKP